MEPTLRTAQVLKQEAEDLGFEGKEILDYVKDQQKLDREERAEWRKIRMAELQGEDKKRVDEIRIAQIGAEAEEKKRADEIHFAQIEAAKEQAKIEAGKELALKVYVKSSSFHLNLRKIALNSGFAQILHSSML